MTGLLPHLMDVSIRSAVLALMAGALLRIRALRTAAWAHAIWTVVLLSMLLLFTLEPLFKPIPLRILPAPRVSVTQEWSGPVVLPSQLASEPGVPSTHGTISSPAQSSPAQRRSLTAGAITGWLYVAVAIGLLARLLVGSWLARRLLAGSVRTAENFYESPRIAVPLTIGWLRPVILLPAAWRRWDRWKLDAVLLHESSHVQRRDTLIAFLAGVNRCLFWFHPLAWWLERKLAFLAERACDEACVCELENRPEYAKLLVEMAGTVEASHGRLFAHSLSMARPSQVHRRVDALLDDNHMVHRGLNALNWAAALTCGIVVVSAAGSMSLESKLAPQAPVPARPAPAQPAPPSIPWSNPPIPRTKPILVAQAPENPPLPPQPDVNLGETQIDLPVTVTEPSGRAVTGLDSANFRITEGLTDRPITTFRLAEGQHAIAILNTIGANGEAMESFRKVLDPRDESFSGDGPPAANIEAFVERIAAAVSEVKQKANPVKAVVVIMQGGRNNPLASEKNVANVLRLAIQTPRVALFFANIEDVSQAVPVSFATSQQDDIRILAGASGGLVLPVARPEEMTTAMTRIGAMLRYQYLLGFVRPALAEGLVRTNIEVFNSPGLPRLQVIGPQVYRR